MYLDLSAHVTHSQTYALQLSNTRQDLSSSVPNAPSHGVVHHVCRGRSSDRQSSMSCGQTLTRPLSQLVTRLSRPRLSCREGFKTKVHLSWKQQIVLVRNQRSRPPHRRRRAHETAGLDFRGQMALSRFAFWMAIAVGDGILEERGASICSPRSAWSPAVPHQCRYNLIRHPVSTIEHQCMKGILVNHLVKNWAQLLGQ
jgi:hypothetical protein